MLKTLSLLIRGSVADQAQAVHDANAVAVLRQQVRDAAGAVSVAKRELAVTMSFQAAEKRALDTLATRVADLEASAGASLADGREDLAKDACRAIAALEDEIADRGSSLAEFGAEVDRLKELVARGEERLRDLGRGLQAARTTEAVRRAGANGRRVIAVSSGALHEAEETLARLRDRQRNERDVEEAYLELSAGTAEGVIERLAAAGYGPKGVDPEAVLARIRSRAAN